MYQAEPASFLPKFKTWYIEVMNGQQESQNTPSVPQVPTSQAQTIKKL